MYVFYNNFNTLILNCVFLGGRGSLAPPPRPPHTFQALELHSKKKLIVKGLQWKV